MSPQNPSTHQAGNRPLRLLKLPSVTRRTGRSRSAIYRGMADGTFPRPVRSSERSVAWIESEIEAWIARCIAASRGGA